MDKVAVLLKELEEAPEPLLDEVLDFVKFLKHKNIERFESALLRTYPETLSTFKISGIFGLQGGFRIDSK
jgi:hypothetical protein